ncbi:hypothetical protein Fleli_3193 [Bernardetia litoralis DSM 6794]|uniref:Uncharacterized protein n=1 Tax=Bernardetia litoralis (strain ATCC 23117 / DSM 6794 / NBRC 15988 / NCIMB 1366 / Fx l1 / Sio-4) TaxID=880071 RepID=I4ANJ0_BERLS|nr:hypothetical protein [Bernardetia litoralis]AFM05525.1 hypothetical protein Fleli_3193 [Bernardetia litoralis DSM 6794]
MHIHKINSTSQEHQNFLAQNRKDPITGDTILEGDEVVFCAGCKSVFLKDTWEYLGNQHCEQSETLVKFPLSSVKLDLVAKDDIFFYTYLYTNDKNQSYIPNLYPEWKVKKRELSKYHYFFNDLPIYLIGILGFLIGWFFFFFLNKNMIVLFVDFVFLFLVILSSGWHNIKYGEKLDTIHKNFKNNVFFFSTKGIGFSSNYGIKESTLDAHHIKSLEFVFTTKFFSVSHCIINDIDGAKIKFQINNFFIDKTDKEFLNALDRFSSMFSIPIHLKINNNERYKSAIDFVNCTESNITIDK